jgi:hypothetical protein
MGRRTSLGSLALGVVLIVAASACTRPTDGYCCTSESQCLDVGGVEQLCPSGQLCDDTGAMGAAHSCYADPDVQTCADDPGSCVDPTPACVGGICVECEVDDQCTTSLAPHCDLSLFRCGDCDATSQCERFAPMSTCGTSGACVQCEPGDPIGESDVCSASSPVCGADGACRRCEDHRECGSGACDLAGGTCAEAGEIAYVDASASGGNTACTSTAKCDSIAKGLAVGRPYVVIAPGDYQEDVIAMAQTVSLIGYGATLRAQTNGAVAIATGGATGEVSVFGLTITASTGGVDCTGSTTLSTARVTLVDCLVSNFTGVGVVGYRCDMVLSRTRVTNANGGGIDLTQAGVDITNSIIDGNGPDGTFGGIQITNPRPQPSRIAFNTIVDNATGAGTTTPGIACASGGVLDAFHSNIIDGNTGAAAQVSGGPNCSYEHSLINPAFGGNENVTGDPMLTADFHIAAASPAKDQGLAGTDITDDFERQLRDATPDIGADELVPSNFPQRPRAWGSTAPRRRRQAASSGAHNGSCAMTAADCMPRCRRGA